MQNIRRDYNINRHHLASPPVRQGPCGQTGYRTIPHRGAVFCSCSSPGTAFRRQLRRPRTLEGHLSDGRRRRESRIRSTPVGGGRRSVAPAAVDPACAWPALAPVHGGHSLVDTGLLFFAPISVDLRRWSYTKQNPRKS